MHYAIYDACVRCFHKTQIACLDVLPVGQPGKSCWRIGVFALQGLVVERNTIMQTNKADICATDICLLSFAVLYLIAV